MKPLFLFVLVCSTLATAKAPSPDDTRYNLEPNTEARPIFKKPQIADTVTNGHIPPNIPVNVQIDNQTAETLRHNRALTETLINRGVVEKRWDWLNYLLPIYRQIPGYDTILADYAQGALWRHEGKQREAIDLYRGIIASHPELSYVRLNLAAMLFENKEYTAAQTQFEKVRAEKISPAAEELVNQYLQAINQQGGWQLGLGLNYEQTDNVNNASAAEKIILGDMTFDKDQGSLPKKAHGFSYSGSLSRDFNLSGNHYLSIGAAVNGVNYWDNHDYDQITARAETGYVYRDIKQWGSIKPYFEKAWFGGDSYNSTVGLNAEYGRWLNKNWQVVANTDVSRIDYRDLDRFDGNRTALSATVAYLPGARWFVYGGADWINEGADVD